MALPVAPGPVGCRASGRAVVLPVTAAVYPARATVAMSSSSLTSRVRTMWADSVARLTLAVTPSSLPSFFSTRATQEAQVMPPTARSTVPIGAMTSVVWLIEGSWGDGDGPVAFAVRSGPSSLVGRRPGGPLGGAGRGPRQAASRSMASTV